MRLTITVVGAGAVGCYLAAKLEQAGMKVQLLGRPARMAAISDRGLTLREGTAESHACPSVLRDGERAQSDLVLLTVRAFDVAPALPMISALIGDRGMVLALQNGVGTEELVAEAVGGHRVVVGTLTTSVSMDEPGMVNRGSAIGGLASAMMDGSPTPGAISDLLRSTRLPFAEIADYRSLRWSKLLLNMLGAASSTILDMDIAPLTRMPAIFSLEQLAMREAGQVMDAMEIATSALPGYPVPLVRAAMRLPRPLAQRLIGPRLAKARGGNAPKMRADMTRGKTEIAWLHGAVVKAGAEHGVPTPVCSVLYDLTERLAANPEAREQYRGLPNRLVDHVAEIL